MCPDLTGCVRFERIAGNPGICPGMTEKRQKRVSPARKKSDIGVKMDITVEVPAIGTFVAVPRISVQTGRERGEVWEITQTATNQVERGVFVTICTIVAIGDEAEEILGIPAQQVNLDILDHWEITD